MVKSIVTLFVVISLTTIAVHTVFSWVPRSSAEIDGVTAAGDEEGVVDLKEGLKQALEKSYVMTITEEELNRYIAKHLKLTHSAIVDDYVSIKGVYVDLKPNLVDITIEREVDYPANLQADGSKKFSFLPLNQTLSMQLAIEVTDSENGDVHTQVSFPGASFGRAPAPGGLAVVVKPNFDVVYDFFQEELKLAYNNGTSITVEDGLLKVDCRKPDARQ